MLYSNSVTNIRFFYIKKMKAHDIQVLKYINNWSRKKEPLSWILFFLISNILWTDMTQKYADIDFH